MKFLSYSQNGINSFGVLISGGRVIDLPLTASAFRMNEARAVPHTLDEGLKRWDDTLQLARRCIQATDVQPGSVVEKSVKKLSDVTFEPPIRHPSKIVGIGLNYMDHCREQKVAPPKYPILFSKFPNSIIGSGETIRWNRRLTVEVDFEAELAVIIGKRSRRFLGGQAMECVAGYTALNDVSARDLQFKDKQWDRGKSLDTFCPIGPFLVTCDEVGDPNRLAITCSVNNVIYQNSNTAEMIFSVPEVVSFISQGITLEPGDVIATGTPNGVGVFRKPPLFLKHGDEVVVSIEKVGDLRNDVEVIDEELPG
jgi:2-keto-4-pentenoate hydratase/2-oxohepta-3-ene-1,7-dioic acid hydratase in catechol pathway